LLEVASSHCLLQGSGPCRPLVTRNMIAAWISAWRNGTRCHGCECRSEALAMSHRKMRCGEVDSSICCAADDRLSSLFCIRRHSVLKERIAIVQIGAEGLLTIGSRSGASVAWMSEHPGRFAGQLSRASRRAHAAYLLNPSDALCAGRIAVLMPKPRFCRHRPQVSRRG
jgi:hypothetical protein